MMARIRRIPIGSLPPQQKAQGSVCVLYVIEEMGSGHFKIGIAGHPIRRLSSLQCGNHRRLLIAAAYEGTRSACRQIEIAALRFFRAKPNSEWVFIDSGSVSEITDFLNIFEVAA